MKALIVDDEKMIRIGIQKVIRWEEIGIEQVFTAASGKEAYEIVEEEKPEIMVTDINMAEMSGLDLIELVKSIVPEMRIIVLTGYDRFEYARQCLRLSVQEFLLKPIDEEVLTQTLKKQVQYLEELKEAEGETNVSRARAAAKQYELEKKLSDYLHGKITGQEIFTEEFYREYPYDSGQSMQAVIIRPPQFVHHLQEEEEYISQSIRNICIGFIDAQGKGITLADHDGRTVILYFVQNGAPEALKDIKKLTEILKDEYNVTLKAVMGSVVNGFRNITVSYNDACLLLEKNKNDFHEIVQNRNLQKRDKLFKEVFSEMKAAMCANVGNADCVMKIYERFKQALESYSVPGEDVSMCCYELASSVYFVYLSDSKSSADDRLPSFMKILMNAGREEACEMTEIFLQNLLQGDEEKEAHQVVTKAKRYIKEHLAEEISVSSLASALYLTPNYFSRLFKRVTGEGCNEYIVQERIEKAKLLLKTTNLRTNRIAAMIGYRDTNYFSLAFKKKTGMSPTKFREQYR
ncbi:response regulator transcription factor [Diplocloster agilis]|uniref:Stage 0 sporulation protein A homolog n=1 Tax=Diplocloster agilis TaxID=2850323 RepID=A0A949NET8_9FIRM|nr:response regulator [Diplocloster agilis]MBU9736792.1 response regulator [Diplocloster agilis]MBU9736819.1 response regulator [Diplocloster agilis]